MGHCGEYYDKDEYGRWVAQSVKHPTLDLGSGHDVVVCGIEPHVGPCTDSVGPAWDPLSLPSPTHKHPL